MFRDKAGNLSIGRIILAAVVLVALIALVGSSFTVIPAGHTGVVLTFGRVNDVVLQRPALQAAVCPADRDHRQPHRQA